MTFVVPGEENDGWKLVRGSITFDGTAGKGAQGTVTLFDVTGQVEGAALFAYCATSLVGAATIDRGLVGATANYQSAQIADATTWDAGMWDDKGATPFASAGDNIFVGDGFVPPVTMSADIILTIGAANITAGVLYYFLWWRPLSADGAVVLGPNMVAI